MICADISDFQASFDMDAYADAGHEFLILKASEGATYRSQQMPGWRDRAHAKGLNPKGGPCLTPTLYPA